MRVQALGVGTPTPSPASWGSSFLVSIADRNMLFDCGPGATTKMVQRGTLPTEINELFLTHLHFDHVVDVPALLLSRWDQGAGNIPPLEIFGPQPTGRFIEDIVGPKGLFRDDINARINHPVSQRIHQNRGGSLPRPRPRTSQTELAPGDHVGRAEWRVTTAFAKHVQPYLDCLAYRIDTDEGSVVFTGDTEPCDTVTELASGADVLFSMCWDLQSRMAEEGEDQGQTGTAGAARMARESGVSKLILVHHGPQLDPPEQRSKVLDDVAAIYDGEVLYADEGFEVELS